MERFHAAPGFVFYTAIDARQSLEQALPLVSVCVEMLKRGHECTFLVREDEMDAMQEAFESLCSQSLPVKPALVKIAHGFRREMGGGDPPELWEALERLVSAAGSSTRLVGMVDTLAAECATIFLTYGVAYYVTFPGTVSKLKRLLNWSLWRKRPCAAAVQVFDGAVACFVSSIDPVDSQCFAPEPPERVHLVRSFGPPPSVMPDCDTLGRFALEEGRGVVIVACSQLTSRGVRSLFQGLAQCRHQIAVIWFCANREIFDDADLDEEPDPPTEDWFVLVEKPRPKPSLLASAKVVCLASSCDWYEATDAIAHGVPVLAVPITPDQHANANVLAELGVARVLDSVDPDAPDVFPPFPPAHPQLRQAERFTPAHVARAILDISAQDSRFQISALSLQINYFSNPDDFGASLVATILESDIDDGTLAMGQAEILKRRLPDDDTQLVHLSSASKANFFSCSDDLFCLSSSGTAFSSK